MTVKPANKKLVYELRVTDHNFKEYISDSLPEFVGISITNLGLYVSGIFRGFVYITLFIISQIENIDPE